jgi:CHAD domain-containing protein
MTKPRVHDQPETEWQFDVFDVRPVERWLAKRPVNDMPTVSPGVVRAITDVYFDTDDWRIFRSGFSLRLRSQDDQVEATLKHLASSSTGTGTGTDRPKVRREISESLPNASLEDLSAASGPVGERVHALIGQHQLRSLFTCQTHRRAFPVFLPEGLAGELTLDQTMIPLGDEQAPVRLDRVELEVLPNAVEHLGPFVERMAGVVGLQPAQHSKFETGLMAVGSQPPGPVDLGSSSVTREQTIGEVAFAVLRKHFAAFLAHEAGTRLGEDPEELHDMRVAARRLRAALSLFRDALPDEAQPLREELSWVARALGAVRDLDVQLGQFAEWIHEADEADRPGLDCVVDLLRQRRQAARSQMLEVLDSARYDRFVADFARFARDGAGQSADRGTQPALAVAPDLIRRRYRKVRALGDAIDESSAPQAYHTLRIEGKRLRYTLEFLSPLYGAPSTRLIANLVALQDLLGAHQDAYVAIDLLRGLSSDDEQGLPGTARFAMGRIAERYARVAVDSRSDFPDVFKRLRGKAWKDLRKIMKRLRPKLDDDSATRNESHSDG